MTAPPPRIVLLTTSERDVTPQISAARRHWGNHADVLVVTTARDGPVPHTAGAHAETIVIAGFAGGRGQAMPPVRIRRSRLGTLIERLRRLYDADGLHYWRALSRNQAALSSLMASDAIVVADPVATRAAWEVGRRSSQMQITTRIPT